MLILTAFFVLRPIFMLQRSKQLIQTLTRRPSLEDYLSRNSIPDEELSVALVMPCTFLEAVTSMPLALDSVLRCRLYRCIR